MGSLVVLAASGILINLIIAAFRDAAALGAFNQAYAVYIVASQIAVFGLHYSVLRHAALYDTDAVERGRLLANAGAFSLLLGACAAVLVLLDRAASGPPPGKSLRGNGNPIRGTGPAPVSAQQGAAGVSQRHAVHESVFRTAVRALHSGHAVGHCAVRLCASFRACHPRVLRCGAGHFRRCVSLPGEPKDATAHEIRPRLDEDGISFSAARVCWPAFSWS